MHKQNEPWTANVVGRMHRYGIKEDELAKECGWSQQYVSMVLNGKKDFKSEKSKFKVKRVIFESLHNLEQEVKNERVFD